MKEKPSAILQELESDDELPDIYNDASILPAYLDDNRFNKIKFPWVTNVSLSDLDTQSKNYKVQYHDILRHKGVLRGQDLYCLKSVESVICSSTLIWFANFLLHKDLQSHYNYLKSCLVKDLTYYSVSFPNKKSIQCTETELTDRFEVVIRIN